MSSIFEFDPDRMAGSGIITRGTAGEALGNRQLIYQGDDNAWYLADADTAATMPTIGITLHSITSGNNGQILLHGYVGLSTWTWITGGSSGVLYASTTPGALIQTAPPGIGDYVQIVGTAITSTIIYFNPMPPSGGIFGAAGDARWYAAPNPDGQIGDHTGAQMADDESTYIYNEVYIPPDFHTLIAADVIVVQGVTANPNMVWTCNTDWGQICVGEDYLEHSDSASGTSALLQDDLVCLDITAALTGIAAEDLVGVSFMRDGANQEDTVNGIVYYLGIRIRYT